MKKLSMQSIDVVSSDEISLMSDFELERHVGKLNAMRHDELHSRSYHRRSMIEVEIAYAQREIQIRLDRYDAHATYITLLQGDELVLNKDEN